jgi:hypothetical protein
MRKEPDFHILFTYPDDLPKEYGLSVEDELKADGLNLKIVEEEPQIWASLEWAVPGLIAAYLAKPYFESFLKEMGKDHYLLFKNWIKKTSSNSRLIRTTRVTSRGATDKIDKDNTQSRAFSLYLQTYEGRTIKLLFDESLAEKAWNENIDLMLDWVMQNHEKYPNDELTAKTSGLTEDPRFSYYAVMNKDVMGWKFYDDHGLVKLMQEKKGAG